MVLAPRRPADGTSAARTIGNRIAAEVAEEKDDQMGERDAELVRHEIEALTQRCQRAEERYAERERELQRHCDAEVEKLRASHEVELARTSAAHGAELDALRTEMSATFNATIAAQHAEWAAERVVLCDARDTMARELARDHTDERDPAGVSGPPLMQQPSTSAAPFATPAVEPAPTLSQVSPPPMHLHVPPSDQRIASTQVSSLPSAIAAPRRHSGDVGTIEAQSRRTWEREQRARFEAERDAMRVASEERARAQQAAWDAELARAAAERSALRCRLDEQLPTGVSSSTPVGSDTGATDDDIDTGSYFGLNKRRGVAAYRAHLVGQSAERGARGTRAAAAPVPQSRPRSRPSPPHHPPGRDRMRAGYGYTHEAVRSAGVVHAAAAPLNASSKSRDFRTRRCVPTLAPLPALARPDSARLGDPGRAGAPPRRPLVAHRSAALRPIDTRVSPPAPSFGDLIIYDVKSFKTRIRQYVHLFYPPAGIRSYCARPGRSCGAALRLARRRCGFSLTLQL